MSLVPAQVRAARALLEWSQGDLGKAAKVAKKTITDIERGLRVPYARTMDALQLAFEQGGVEFIDENGGGPGLRFRARQQAAG